MCGFCSDFCSGFSLPEIGVMLSPYEIHAFLSFTFYVIWLMVAFSTPRGQLQCLGSPSKILYFLCNYPLFCHFSWNSSKFYRLTAYQLVNQCHPSSQNELLMKMSIPTKIMLHLNPGSRRTRRFIYTHYRNNVKVQSYSVLIRFCFILCLELFIDYL